MGIPKTTERLSKVSFSEPDQEPGSKYCGQPFRLDSGTSHQLRLPFRRYIELSTDQLGKDPGAAQEPPIQND